jgi:alpha-D-xyloside xylohydrolase
MEIKQFGKDNGALTWKGEGEYLRVESWGANSVRIRSSLMHDIKNADWALISPSAPVLESTIEIDEEKGTASLTNGDITVKLEASTWQIGGAGYDHFRCHMSFWNSQGKKLFEEEPRGGALDIHAREFLPYANGDVALKASFVSPPDEHLYGMGEYQQSVMDLKGCSFELAHRNSQASIPFVVSSGGYGFLWNNPALGTAVFAKNRTEWRAESSNQLDYWVCAGDTPQQIEEQYSEVTGRAPKMPEWGLGFWQCKLRYWNQQQLLETAREFKKRQIPIDVIIVDFFHWPLMGDYRLEKEFWPDPKAMCDELHQMGIKVMVSVWPQVSLQSENYAQMRSQNLLVRADRGEDIGMMFEGPSQFFDATNPSARKFVWQKCKENYADLGFDGFWLDEAEPEYGTGRFENYRYCAGAVERVGNIYPKEFNRAFYEGQLSMGREDEIVNLTRCAWAGSQRYGSLVWSGDVHSTFADLRAQITCAVQMGMAGIPWFTTDMGGFAGGDISSSQFKELLARWCQFSCFLPVMRNHGDRNDNGKREEIFTQNGSRRSPSGVANEPWSYGDEIEHIFRKYINVREGMRPYTRELFEEAHESGHPIVRGLFYEFPDDERAADIRDEYLFGPDLLIAPVTCSGATGREVYLPGGDEDVWVNCLDGQSFSGGTTISVDAELDEIPVFAREGADHGVRRLLTHAAGL